MKRGITVATLAVTSLLFAQKYSGPRPPKPDLPYLLHGDNLLPVEIGEAKEEQQKDGLTYVVNGASSSAKTPLAGPIFLMESDKLNPEQLQLYRLEVKNGRREITFRKKKNNQRPIHLSVQKIAPNLWRLEADETLENGEYSLTPEGSNQVFCFEVY